MIIAYTFLCDVHSDYPIVGIGIRDDYQGEGIGKALMNHLLGVAREQGRKGLRLTVYEDNVRALRLYSHLGFEKVRTDYHMRINF